ncbi:COG1470 family protein [Kribbella sp. NPDC004138]
MQGTRKARHRLIRFLIVGVCLLLAAAGLAYAAQPTKPGITLGITPTSQSVTRGQTATYTISVTSTGGFTGAVALSATGVPANASASFSPASMTLTSGGTASTTLTVSTTSGTPTGSATLTVQGTGTKVSGTITAGLTVNAPLSSAVALTVTPASVTLAPGSTAVFTAQLTRTNFPGAVTFETAGGLPSGATATFTPNPTTGNSSTLQVTTPATADDGTFTLYLVASGKNPAGVTQYAYATVQLVLATTGKPFAISGDLSGTLAPGISRPLDLTLTNPNKKPISVTNLTVTVQSVTRTSYATTHNLPCAPADYKVTHYGGTYPLTVPGSGNASLSGLGIAQSAWPQVTMLDTATNQDGCKGATITLAYAGSGQGS